MGPDRRRASIKWPPGFRLADFIQLQPLQDESNSKPNGRLSGFVTMHFLKYRLIHYLSIGY